MKTTETINSVCTELGITKADLVKRIGIGLYCIEDDILNRKE